MSSFKELEDLGRIQLSESFFLRDFLYSEIAASHGLPNEPVDLELLVGNGRRLCETILEPLQQTFGRIHIRSGYRSPELNDFGHRKGLKCASNKRNFAHHIWDVRDERGNAGASTCIVIPWFLNRYGTLEWRRLAWWLHDHLDYHRIVFFSRQTAFNIGWRDNPSREISSYLEPRELGGGPTILTGPRRPADPDRGSLYREFPQRGAEFPVTPPSRAVGPEGDDG